MWKVGNIAPVSVLGVDSAYGFNITTERGPDVRRFGHVINKDGALGTHTGRNAHSYRKHFPHRGPPKCPETRA